MSINQIASDLYKAITESDERKPRAGDVKATVVKEDGDTVWVKFPGGEDETPVQRTNNATVGDEVVVRVANGRAWILGNNTNPATDDTEAKKASAKAFEAFDAAAFASASAEIAKTAADSALKSAVDANENAEIAKDSADSAQSSAEQALNDASSAQASATSAYRSAETAINQLSIVENVVGVLDLVAKHGEYSLTTDTEVRPNKWYFIRTGTDPNYVYQVVVNPTGDPSTEGWYELTSIDEAIQNYVSSQLVVDESGLWLKTAGMQTKVLLSATDGVVLYGTNGQVVGKYGDTAQIGDGNSFHISLSGTRLGFWKGTETDPNNEIAYISGQQLYITKSVVLQQMDLGIMVIDGGLGQWSWKVHANGQTPSRNNLNLKWIG